MVETRSKNLTVVMIAHTAPASPPPPPAWQVLGLPGAALLASRTAAADSWLAPRSRSRGLPRMSPPPQPPPPLSSDEGCPPPCWQVQGSPAKFWSQVKAEEPGEAQVEPWPLQVQVIWPVSLQQEPGDQRTAQPGLCHCWCEPGSTNQLFDICFNFGD